jgi:hypothetical protein
MSNLKTDKIDTNGASSLEIVKPLEVSSTCLVTSTLTVEGSTVLGDTGSDTHTFTGDVDINDDLNVDGSIVVVGGLTVAGEVLNTSQGMEYIGTLSQTAWVNEIVIEAGSGGMKADWSSYHNIRVVYVIASKNYTNQPYYLYLRRGASTWTQIAAPGQTQKSSSYSWDVITQECLDIRNTNTALGSTSIPISTRVANNSGDLPSFYAPHGTIAGSATHVEAIKFDASHSSERLNGYFALWGIRN